MHTLRLEGEVEQPLEVGFDDLSALPGQISDLTVLVPGREGGAVRLAALLEKARPKSAATHATLTSSDGGFSASVPLGALADAVVAYREGDGPLPEGRGGPFRFFIPDGGECASAEVDRCANVKFLVSVRLTIGRGDDTRPTNPTEHAALHTHDEE